MSYPITIAYDFRLMRPGCVLVQVGLGATIDNEALSRFPLDSWLTAPTDGMKLATLHTEDELDRAVALTREAA